MRLALTAAIFLGLSAPAFAQGSLQNGSEASRQVSQAAGAIGESGLKAASGVVAVPFGAVAVASGAAGHSANASGYTDIGTGLQAGAASATKAATAFVDFSGSPLTVSDDIIVGRKPAQKPVAQPAPAVPYAPAE
ncbi:MAG: hypothetical protein B7Y90_18540 [Alphaproteobacteria bacterium 32-64-14]|nr:MAG: hypothetical protein B7Y90_18540 [Alphaproteobacteria bacterium 32-64-14]